MIQYVEIRDTNREVVGIVDTAKSIIWHSVWFGVGDFEIYAKATTAHLNLLQVGNYVTRPEDENIGVIESIKIMTSVQDGTMITATGRFAKAYLDRRLIYNISGDGAKKTNHATVLRGRVENAVRGLIHTNAVDCDFDARRNIAFLGVIQNLDIPEIIVDDNGNPAEKQVSHQNLLEYTDSLLEEYGLSGIVTLDDDTKKLMYRVRKGTDRSADNTNSIDPVIFSKDYDNISSSEYSYDKTQYKNTALIGGEGEGLERFYSLVAIEDSGIARKEVFVDAASLNKSLKEDELQNLFPTGTFSGINFVVGGVVYAVLVIEGDGEYSLSTLQSKFSSGTVSGTNFLVGGVVYATKIYGDENNYKITPIGYRALLTKDGSKGTYELTDERYKIMLNTKGKQDLAERKIIESFAGTIIVTSGNYILNEDFFLGDYVTVQENSINKYINVRITEITEVQDENGYTVDVVYQ